MTKKDTKNKGHDIYTRCHYQANQLCSMKNIDTIFIILSKNHKH